MKDTIDRNMRLLCRVLNENGYRTIGCCGGHRNPKRGQNSFRTWFVSIRATPAKMQWLIDFAKYEDDERWLTFSDPTWKSSEQNVDGLTTIVFMRGRHIDPVEFAKYLEKALANLPRT